MSSSCCGFLYLDELLSVDEVGGDVAHQPLLLVLLQHPPPEHAHLGHETNTL